MTTPEAIALYRAERAKRGNQPWKARTDMSLTWRQNRTPIVGFHDDLAYLRNDAFVVRLPKA